MSFYMNYYTNEEKRMSEQQSELKIIYIAKIALLKTITEQ